MLSFPINESVYTVGLLAHHLAFTEVANACNMRRVGESGLWQASLCFVHVYGMTPALFFALGYVFSFGQGQKLAAVARDGVWLHAVCFVHLYNAGVSHTSGVRSPHGSVG